MSKFLVKGFEPFDRYNLNPSAEIANALNGSEIGDSLVVGAVLPLDYKTVMNEFSRIIEETNPDVFLCCGQANRAAVTIERMGFLLV